MISTDEEKVVALAPIFFLSLPPLRDSRQIAIDFAWCTRCPLDDRDFVEMSWIKAWDAVKSMPLASIPS